MRNFHEQTLSLFVENQDAERVVVWFVRREPLHWGI